MEKIDHQAPKSRARKDVVLQGKRGHNTIRRRMMLALFLITTIGFGVVLFTVSRIVEDYFVQQRVDSVRAQMLQWRDGLEEPFAQSDGEILLRTATELIETNKGHILLVDEQGVVQVDTAAGAAKAATAQQLDYPELQQVLWGGESFANGLRQYTATETGEENFWEKSFPKSEWAMYYVMSIPDTANGDKTMGAILYSAQLTDVMERVASIRTQIALAMLLVLIAMMAASYILARSVTQPIVEMTRVIRRMARGEMSLRIPVHGQGELAELTQTFNDMSEKIENNEKFRNEFVSNASHELKTPLATMKILIETLIYQDVMDEAMTRDFLGDINREIDRLNGVITDLLHLVQVDKREAELKREDTDVADICRDVVKRLQPISQKRNIEVKTDLNSCIASIDPIKMDQVVLNLTENAVKYSNDGAHVLLSCYKEGNECVIRVKDDGVGIPEEDQKHVFDRFYRVDKARSRETGGTGLGLSIVDGIVKLHGGTITLESEMGEGSEFIVRVPIAAPKR